VTDDNYLVERPETAFYGTRWAATIPLVVMLGPVIALTFFGVLSSEVLVATGIIGIAAGSLACRRKTEYWDVVTRSLTDPLGLIVFSLFLLVGIYGKLLTSSQLTEGIVWLSQQLEFGPGLFTLFVYVICSILGTAMGTSLGIVVIMTPILYPAAVGLGVDPMIAAGAILSGAATGDHLAPVSDTTIISSMTQRYRNKSGSAEISGVVRARLAYVLPAFAVGCAMYLVVGGVTGGAEVAELTRDLADVSGRGLVMLIPMAVVVAVAISRRTIFEALTYGIIAGIVVALAAGLITTADLFFIEGMGAKGILVEGAIQNIDTIAMIILLMGAYGVMRAYGVLDTLIGKLDGVVGRSPRDTELTMFGFTWLLSFALIGLVGRLTVIAGPIVNALGQTQDLHPYRRANILDAVVNSFSFIIPWHVWPILMILQIRPLTEQNAAVPVPAASDFLLTTYYPVAIWCVMLIAIFTGYGRKFEGPAGEVVTEKPSS
jgi:Na+/H+ antiporter NhaC